MEFPLTPLGTLGIPFQLFYDLLVCIYVRVVYYILQNSFYSGDDHQKLR